MKAPSQTFANEPGAEATWLKFEFAATFILATSLPLRVRLRTDERGLMDQSD